MLDDRRQILAERRFSPLARRQRGRRLARRARLISLMTDATNSGNPSVRSCNARTNASSLAIDWRSFRHVVGDLAFGERIEHDLLAQVMQAQLAPQRVERMVERHDLGEAKACKPHEPRAATAPRDVVDELDRRAVAPMQVLGHQQQRPALARAIEKLAHLAQHAIRADAGELSSQRFALLRGAEPRQLQEPGRRDRAQQRDERAVAAAQLRQRFQHGKIRLAGAVVLDALAARTATSPRLAMKCSISVVLPIPGSPATQTIARLPLHAMSQARRRRDSGFGATDEVGHVRGGNARNAWLDAWRSGDRTGGGDEAVPAPRHGLR